MKKLVILTIFLFFGFVSVVEAQDPTDLVLDVRCNYFQNLDYSTRKPFCNTFCEYSCVNLGKHCSYGSTTDCSITDGALQSYYVTTTNVGRAFDIFGVELCPDASTRPPDDPYCMINLVRLGFYGVISILIFILVLMALWVVWVRSTAADSPEKVEKAATIAKNAIIGAVITFLFIAIVQVVSLLVGLTGNIFDIAIVPQPKMLGTGDPCGTGYVQCPVGTICIDKGAGKICSNP